MAERHIVQTALALRTFSQRTARHATKSPERGVILSVAPLQVELTQSGLTLDESEILLSHSVRQYDGQYGLAVGDTLIVHPLSGGDLVATAVIAAASSTSGAAKQATAAPGEKVGAGSLSGASAAFSGGTYGVSGGAGGSVTIPDQQLTVSGGTVPGTALVGKVAFRDDDGNLVGYIPLI